MLTHLTGLVGDPYFWMLIGMYWLVSNAISALPIPTEKSTPFYGWLFKFANGFNGNLTRAFAGKIPGAQ